MSLRSGWVPACPPGSQVAAGRQMREAMIHVGTKLSATAAQRVMDMSGSPGHDDTGSQVSKVQKSHERSRRELTQKSL